METRDVVRYPQMERNEHTIRVPTTGVFDFPSLILEGEGKYVDKTELLYRLAAPRTDAQYFISRPRRFGKSLMLSSSRRCSRDVASCSRGLRSTDFRGKGGSSRPRCTASRRATCPARTTPKSRSSSANWSTDCSGRRGLRFPKRAPCPGVQEVPHRRSREIADEEDRRPH